MKEFKKDALAAYAAGRIVAEPGAVVTPKYPTGAMVNCKPGESIS